MRVGSLVQWHQAGVRSTRILGRSSATAAAEQTTRGKEESEADCEVRRRRRPSGHWGECKHRKAFLEAAAAEVGGWRHLTADDVRRAGGGGLLGIYGSFSAAVKATYEEIPEGARVRAAHGTWREEESRRELLTRVRESLGVGSGGEWALVTRERMTEAGGRPLLKAHGSVRGVLRALSPSEAEEMQEWERREGQRARVGRGQWREIEKARAFLNSLAASRGFSPSEKSAWASVTTADVVTAGGGGLLAAHGGSLRATLAHTYGGEWAAADCRPRGRTDWTSPESVSELVRDIGARLGISKPEEWARVSVEQLRSAGGSTLLSRMSLSDALAVAYPEEDSDALRQLQEERRGTGRKAAQAVLYRHLRALATAAQTENCGRGGEDAGQPPLP